MRNESKNKEFSLQIERKKESNIGVIVMGKVHLGELSQFSDVSIVFQSNSYKAAVSYIIVNGKKVEKCMKRQVVTLHLVGVKFDEIVCGHTYVRNYQKNTSVDENISNSAKNLITSSVKKLNCQDKSILTANEKEYVSNIKQCLLQEGKVAPTERYLLEKLRIALNLSESRAIELEKDLIKLHPEKNEKEYSDAVSICLLDCNYISTTERFILNRLRITLNISENRATEIERNCDWHGVLNVE
jgi:hypothetical protein